MAAMSFANWMLEQEARALLTRLDRVKSFALHESMLPAAGLLPDAQTAIEDFLAKERGLLRRAVRAFIEWLHGAEAAQATPAEAQRRFTFLRLKFNAVLTQFDLFSDVITQRSESEIGVWLSGLDVVSTDALALRGGYYRAPPVICYLDRGSGAAIRRARTRMPGGGHNPVAIIRVPRERMVGSGIASSLVHEVGHQAAALLDLVESLRPVLRERQSASTDGEVWIWWERWISEIVADLWSVARVGITSTIGLIGVVSLPRAFVFRINGDAPHPVPWIRVKLSAAIGQGLYPHAQWARLSELWERFYPRDWLDPERSVLFEKLVASMPEFVSLLINHRPGVLGGESLREALDVSSRRPARLAALLDTWTARPAEMYGAPPALVFAVLGQGRFDGRLSPEAESEVLAKLLTHWALRSTLDVAAACASHGRESIPAAVRSQSS